MDKIADYDDIPVVELDDAHRPAIQCLLAKLTDFSIATIKNAMKESKMAGRKPRMMVHVDADGMSGFLKIWKEKNDDSVIIRWQLNKVDNPEMKEIVTAQSKGLCSIGDIKYRFNILATDSTFSEAGRKQKKLIEESLEKSSKIEIKQPSSKHFNNRPKIMPSTSKGSYTKTPKSFITPTDRLKSQQNVQKVQPIQSDHAAPSNQSGSSREPIRYRIIHTLAGVTRTKNEIFTTLQRDGGIDEQDHANFDKIIEEVSEATGDNKLKLRDEILSTEINPNYPHWDSMQKRVVQKMRQQATGSAQKITAAKISKSNISETIGIRSTNSPRPPMVRLKNKNKEKDLANKAKENECKLSDKANDDDEKMATDRIEELAAALNDLLANTKQVEPDTDYMQQYSKIGTFDQYKDLHAKCNQLYKEYSVLHDKLNTCKQFMFDTYTRFIDKATPVSEREDLLKTAHDRLQIMINEGELHQDRQKLVNCKHHMAAIRTRLNQFDERTKEPIPK